MFLLSFLRLLIEILTFAIIARALLSWFPIRPGNPVMLFLYSITEPILAPIRQIIPSLGAIDISPLIAILLLQIIAYLLP